jgi:hypothetical protein
MAIRGTQSFVHVLGGCWRRPSLLAIELTWRWLFGIPLLAVLGWQGLHIYRTALAQLNGVGLDQFSLMDPNRAAVISAGIYAVLAPPLVRLFAWLAPVAVIAWSVISGIGRNAVLRRYDPTLPSNPLMLVVMQLWRILFLGGTVIFWFRSTQWSAAYALSGSEPNLVAYFALSICLSLAVFVLWTLVSWIFSIAPLLGLLEGCSMAESIRRSLRLGPLTGKLIEINFIMGIVKMALVVLAMVFSATIVPFAAEMTQGSLYLWWGFVTVLYLAASDFFQVARLIAFIELWKGFRQPTAVK